MSEIRRDRWAATRASDGRRWTVVDIWCPGDFCGWFVNKREALEEARKRNGPHLTIVGAPRHGNEDDDVPFRGSARASVH